MNKLKFFVLLIVLIPIFNLNAQAVDIVWQGETYTPPFYEGRSMWSYQSLITLMGVPSGPGFENSSNLIYRWTRNGTVIGTASGMGRKSLTFADSVLSKPLLIELDIRLPQDPDTIVARASTNIIPRPPSILIYENNPLYGYLFHKEVGQTYPIKDEVTFASFPFFFSGSTRTAAPLEYYWSSGSGNSGNNSSITFRAPEDASGVSNVSVRISNSDKFTQGRTKNFLVQFNKDDEF